MKSVNLPIAAGVLALLALAEPQVFAQTQVVFDNTSNLINKTPDFAFGREYGDELILAGVARKVTEFRFAYYGNFSVSQASYTIRFYANDGSDAFPGAPTALRPRKLLWDSGEQVLNKGVNAVTLNVPAVTVPDKFTWAVTFNGLDGTVGNQAALMLANPATIGAVLPGNKNLPDTIGSYDDFWKKDEPSDDESWRLYSFGYAPSDPKGNFYAKVTAVTDAPPNLNITRVDDVVVISWPSSSTPIVLERADSLSSAGDNWVALSLARTTSNRTTYVTDAIAPANAIYRLRQP